MCEYLNPYKSLLRYYAIINSTVHIQISHPHLLDCNNSLIVNFIVNTHVYLLEHIQIIHQVCEIQILNFSSVHFLKNNLYIQHRHYLPTSLGSMNSEYIISIKFYYSGPNVICPAPPFFMYLL